MQATLRIIVNNVVVNDKKLTIPWIHYLTSCHNQTFATLTSDLVDCQQRTRKKYHS